MTATGTRRINWATQIYNAVIWAKHQVIKEERLAEFEIDRLFTRIRGKALMAWAAAPKVPSHSYRVDRYLTLEARPFLKEFADRSKEITADHMAIAQRIMRQEIRDAVLMKRRRPAPIVEAAAYETPASPQAEDLEGLIPWEDVPLETYQELVDLEFTQTTLHAWSKTVATKGLPEIATQLATSLALGEGMDQVTKRLHYAFDLPRQSALKMARTAIQAAANEMQDRAFKTNSDLIQSLIFTATLDVRTCPVCGGYDGNEYSVYGIKPGIPVHMLCRCGYSPRMKSAQELGLGPLELPAPFRESMDGLAPRSLKYKDWIAEPENQERLKAFQREERRKAYQRAKKRKKNLEKMEEVRISDITAELLAEAEKQFFEGMKHVQF